MVIVTLIQVGKKLNTSKDDPLIKIKHPNSLVHNNHYLNAMKTIKVT